MVVTGVPILTAALMFALLRRHPEPARHAWLAALRDEQLGPALLAMHREPEQPWTLDGLAREAGMSRSAFSARFTAVVGEPAMQYLADWRLHLAYEHLGRSAEPLSAVARRFGYGSEAALSRAFKRVHGLAPGGAPHVGSAHRACGLAAAAARRRRLAREPPGRVDRLVWNVLASHAVRATTVGLPTEAGPALPATRSIWPMADLLRWPVRAGTAALVCGPLLAAYWTTPWELACLAVAGVLHTEVGLRLWRERPDSRMGPLLVACGLVWLLDAWGRVGLPAVFAGGLMLSIVHDPMHLHAGLVVTSGRLRGWWDRVIAAAGYAYWPVLTVAAVVVAQPGLAHLLQLRAWTYPLVGVFLAGVFIVRYRRAGADDRRVYAPFWAALAANGLCTAALSTVTYGPGHWPTVLYALGATLIPVGAALSAQRAERRRLREARDRERRRVERDVHDGVQQRLLAAAMMLRQDDPVLIARGAQEVEYAIADLRDLVRGMNPVALVRYGLSGAVAAVAERARVPVAVDDRVGHVTLPEPVAAAAYYVTMEAVANSEKHADAGLVTVTLTAEGDRVEVTVRDDGVGGARAVPGGGLQGLQERVESCGGTLRVSSARGTGTAVRAVLPLGAS